MLLHCNMYAPICPRSKMAGPQGQSGTGADPPSGDGGGVHPVEPKSAVARTISNPAAKRKGGK